MAKRKAATKKCTFQVSYFVPSNRPGYATRKIAGTRKSRAAAVTLASKQRRQGHYVEVYQTCKRGRATVSKRAIRW